MISRILFFPWFRLAVQVCVIVAAFTAAVALSTPTSAASPLPPPTNYINDYAGVLSPEEESSLNATLKQFEDSTTNQIFVAIVRDLGGQDIESYAGEVFADWKIGQKEKDNGILILASIEDDIRRIEIGYGLEGSLTDGQAGTIIRETLKPNFQTKMYSKGLSETIERIIKHITGQDPIRDSDTFTTNLSRYEQWIIVLAIVVFQVIAALFAWLAKSKAWWHGGLFGGGLGIVLGIVFTSIVVAIIAGLILAVLGFFIDFVLSRMYKPGSFVRRGPWFWGGGGFGGGGFGGGGFGGGGGGSSGGGGASG